MNVKSYDEMIRERRMMLKSEENVERDEWAPHQIKGIPPPSLEKPYPEDGVLVGLGSPNCADLGKIPLAKAIVQRRSRRKYSSKALKLEELSFLLYATQRVKHVDEDGVRSKRVVPSGGARHPFETYLIVNRVEDLEPGVYRYLAIEHKLLVVDRGGLLSDKISKACRGQAFIGESAVVFVWAAIPYRTEWRYSVIAYKDILIEAGHICQNLYLACEAIRAGTCAIAAYDQKAIDSLIGVDGTDEFTVYLAPVGKV
jgi:SagB-type dehydrogenase family enzyme